MANLQLVTAALCRDILIDQITQAFSFVNIIESVFVSSLPNVLADIKLGALWRVAAPGASTSYTMRTLLIRPDGRMEGLLENKIAETPSPFQKIYIRIGQIALNSEGLHWVALETTVNGATHRHAELPFLVAVRREAKKG
ncbi:MAG: hypothetical protein ACOCWR_09010 [Oceanidesulfovibrio sp.]